MSQRQHRNSACVPAGTINFEASSIMTGGDQDPSGTIVSTTKVRNLMSALGPKRTWTIAQHKPLSGIKRTHAIHCEFSGNAGRRYGSAVKIVYHLTVRSCSR